MQMAEEERVRATPTAEDIVPKSAIDQVVATTPRDVVPAAVTIDGVSLASANEKIIPIVTINHCHDVISLFVPSVSWSWLALSQEPAACKLSWTSRSDGACALRAFLCVIKPRHLLKKHVVGPVRGRAGSRLKEF
jgi:hypothetical protein